jgi:hypothetical protein
MIKRCFFALCCVLWAVTCYAQTAIRPDQICPGGVCATPDVTWGPGAGGYQIGTTIAWRTDNTATPTLTSADIAKVVELTFNGPIGPVTVPAATAPLGDGAGFTIQVGQGTLTLACANSCTAGAANAINGLTSLKIGPYQTVSLLSRSGKWYANMSVPQPAAQTGGTTLCDNMAWTAFTTGCVAAGGVITATGVHGLTNPGTTLTLTGTTLGTFFTVELASINAGASSYTLSTNNGTSCTESPGTFILNGSASSDIWYCANNAASGSITFTTTAPGGGSNFIAAQEWSGAIGPGLGIGNHVTGTTQTTLSVTTNGNLTQNNQLIVSIAGDNSSFPTGVGGSQTLIDSIASYQIGGTANNPITHTFNWASGNSFLTLSIAAFKH